MLLRLFIAHALLACAISVQAAERVAPFSADDFQRLHKLIQPQAGESPWRDIAWLTNVTEARQRAATEGKPIVIFTAADGSPLSRT